MENNGVPLFIGVEDGAAVCLGQPEEWVNSSPNPVILLGEELGCTDFCSRVKD
jgi:hypothetical protein